LTGAGLSAVTFWRASASERWEAIRPASATPRTDPSKPIQPAIANASTTNQPAFRNDGIPGA